GESALGEQVLQEIGDAKCDVEGVGRVGEAEIVREHTKPDEPGEAAAENADGDEQRRATGTRLRHDRSVESNSPPQRTRRTGGKIPFFTRFDLRVLCVLRGGDLSLVVVRYRFAQRAAR